MAATTWCTRVIVRVRAWPKCMTLDADIIYVLEGSATVRDRRHGGEWQDDRAERDSRHHRSPMARFVASRRATCSSCRMERLIGSRTSPVHSTTTSSRFVDRKEEMIMTRLLPFLAAVLATALLWTISASGQMTADAPAVRPDAIVNLATDEGAALVRGAVALQRRGEVARAGRTVSPDRHRRRTPVPPTSTTRAGR